MPDVSLRTNGADPGTLDALGEAYTRLRTEVGKVIIGQDEIVMQVFVSLLSREMTLRPGDVIACGTSVGALPMRPGMLVEVTIEGIGTLRNTYAPG